MIVGDKGKMLRHRLIPDAQAQEFGKPPQVLPRSPGHYVEWINACKGGPPAGSNFVDHAAHLAEVVLLGNIAIRTQGEALLGRREPAVHQLRAGQRADQPAVPGAGACSRRGHHRLLGGGATADRPRTGLPFWHIDWFQPMCLVTHRVTSSKQLVPGPRH